MTNSSGNITESASYDSFGNATGNLNTRYQFTGREFDNFTGLHFYRARFYDANLGRFISEDPIGFVGRDINLYGYVGNNPLGFTDSFGLSPDWSERVWQAQQDVIEFTAPAIEFGIGFGDTVTWGTSKYVRQWQGISFGSLECSAAYKAGEWTGFAVELATGASGILKAAGKFGVKNLIKNGAKDLLNSLNRFPKSSGLRQIRPNGAVHDLVDPNGLLQLNPTRLIVSENHIKDIAKVFNNYNGKINALRPEFWKHVLPHRHIYDLRNAPAVLNANWRTTFQNLGAVKTTIWW